MRRIAAGMMAWLLCVASFAHGAGPAKVGKAADAVEAWSGRYHLHMVEGARVSARPETLLVIAPAALADPARLVDKYHADLRRWSLAVASDTNPDDRLELRRFLREEYEEWDWTQLYDAGKIKCLDGGRMFMCQVSPGTNVAFGPAGPKQEHLLARTGLFGIALHAGAFELNKE